MVSGEQMEKNLGKNNFYLFFKIYFCFTLFLEYNGAINFLKKMFLFFKIKYCFLNHNVEQTLGFKARSCNLINYKGSKDAILYLFIFNQLNYLD